jgi:alpha-N-arabinofuranosidase
MMKLRKWSWTPLLALCAQAGFAGSYQATVTVDGAKSLGEIDPEIYGQYIEHVDEKDECIYPAIWDDQSPKSDAMGLRKDVMEAAKQMGVPVVRWPGGCFADVYHWENAIGPRDRRPVVPNKHWGGNEKNQFGTDEFLTWSEKVGNKAYINVNLGSGTLEEALRWLEYSHGAADSPQGKRRAGNGRKEPYKVPYWGIGNETWGTWETGHMDARSYAPILAEWTKAMKKQDPSIKVLGVGSHAAKDPAWDREVLSKAGGVIDYLTLHVYGSSVHGAEGNYERAVFAPELMDFRIKQMAGVIREAKAAHGYANDVKISIDEWNIRRIAADKGNFGRKLRRKDPRDVTDALFVAGFFNAMLKNAESVKMANYVFLVNGHAPLLVNESGVVKTPLFHLFKEYQDRMTGQSVGVSVEAPKAKVASFNTGGEKPTPVPEELKEGLPYVDAASAKKADGTISISLINRHESDDAEVKLNLPEGYRVTSSWTLGADDKHLANDFGNPDRVVPEVNEVKDSVSKWTCKPGRVILLTCVKN